MACRLCLHFGIDDPEQWFEDCPDRVWDLWQAYFNAEPETFGFVKVEKPKPIVDQLDALRAAWQR